MKSENGDGKEGVLEKNSFCIPIRLLRTLFLQGLRWPKRRAVFIGFVVATFSIGAMFSSMGQVVLAESKKSPKQSRGQNDVQRLAGRWVRPDGGYILELREIKKDGSLKVSYFNPRPIKVFSAKWSRKEGKINLFVELRDVNYPGSTYNLQYAPESDRLEGTYFQAVERQTFDIHFVRER